jgi:putative phosphoesterase
MRVALLADIHGNSIALDAVLADIQRRGGVDAYWILGDLAAIGFDPAGSVERLRALPNAIFIRGNAERYVSWAERPGPFPDDVRTDIGLLELFAEVVSSFSWTQGYLEGRGQLEWIRSLPLEQRLTLPGGEKVLLVHAAPGTDDGNGLNPGLSDEAFAAELQGCDADLICVGHFHMPMDRRLNGQRVINPGSVSNNFAPDLRASYAILEADAQGYDVQFYRVNYDIAATIEAVKKSSSPGVPYVLKFCEGKIRAPWLNEWDGIMHAPVIAE